MRGTFRLFTLFGIPVKIHWSFILVFGLALPFLLPGESGLSNTLWYGGLMLALYLCVVLHEYGHALMARRFGVDTRDIILLPIGGVARLQKLPEKPMEEFWIAIAGPLVNVVIVLLLLPAILFFPVLGDHLRGIVMENSNFGLDGRLGIEFFLPGLLLGNAMLVGFNLLPAFPMDGGRVLRALLALRLPRLRATRIASRTGQAMAVAFLLYALYNGAILLALIAVFIFMAARREYQFMRTEQLITGFRVGDVLPEHFTRLFAWETVADALQAMQRGSERHFAVFDSEAKLLGLVLEGDITRIAKERDPQWVRLSEIVRNPEGLLRSDSSLLEALKLLTSGKIPALAVVQDDEIKGVVDGRMLNEFIKLQEKIR